MDRHNRDMLCLGLPFVATILLMVVGSVWFNSIVVFFSGFAIAAPLAIVGIVRQIRRYLRLPCPTCGTVLHRSDKAEDGTPITFLCTACDTEWDTGYRTSSGD